MVLLYLIIAAAALHGVGRAELQADEPKWYNENLLTSLFWGGGAGARLLDILKPG